MHKKFLVSYQLPCSSFAPALQRHVVGSSVTGATGLGLHCVLFLEASQLRQSVIWGVLLAVGADYTLLGNGKELETWI